VRNGKRELGVPAPVAVEDASPTPTPKSMTYSADGNTLQHSSIRQQQRSLTTINPDFQSEYLAIFCKTSRIRNLRSIPLNNGLLDKVVGNTVGKANGKEDCY